MDNQFGPNPLSKTGLNVGNGLSTGSNTGSNTGFHYVGATPSDTLNNINSWQEATRNKYYNEKNEEIGRQAQEMYECAIRTDDGQVKKMNLSGASLNNMALLIKQASNEQGYHSYDELDPGQTICRYLNKNPHRMQLTQDTLSGKISIDDWAAETGMGIRSTAEIAEGDRGRTFNSDVGIRGNITPETSERNDNLIPYYTPREWDEVDGVLDGVGTLGMNLIGSIYNLGASLVDMAINPIDTVTNIFKLGVGAADNIAGRDDEIDTIENESLKKFVTDADEIADGMGEVLLDRYRGRDENGDVNDFRGGVGNFLENLYADPAGMVTDVTSGLAGSSRVVSKVASSTSKLAKNANTINKLEKISAGASKLSKAAEKIDPINVYTHPKDTLNAVKGGISNAWDYTKKTDLGQGASKVISKIDNVTGISKKLNKLRGLADTWAGKMLFPEAKDIYKKLAPMGTKDIGEFESTFGKKYGDHLNDYGITGKNPQEIVEKLQSVNDDLYKQITEGVKSIKEPIKLEGEQQMAMRNMLLFNIEHAVKTQPWNRDLINRLVSDYTAIEKGEIPASNFLFDKRYFERKTKFTYGHQNAYNPVRRELSTNIDSVARDILLDHAEKNGLTNMKDINKEIRMNRKIIDGMGRDIVKDYVDGIGLSDIILAAASYDSKSLARQAIGTWLNSPKVLNWRLKIGNAIRGKGGKSKFSNVDMDAIYKKNAENYINNKYDLGMGDGTPRLSDSVQGGGVVATDNANWAKQDVNKSLGDTQKFIETYAEGQPKIPGNSSAVEIIESTAKDKDVKKAINTVKIDGTEWMQDDFFSDIIN